MTLDSTRIDDSAVIARELPRSSAPADTLEAIALLQAFGVTSETESESITLEEYSASNVISNSSALDPIR